MEDIKELMSKLTVEEKAALANGKTFWTTAPVERLGIPSVLMTDGPHGLRKELGAESGKGGTNIMKGSEKATCFPPAVTLASAWDRNLVGSVGKAIGEEACDQNISTVLGPGTNIKRSPLCGRNFEYFSEDPYLAGEMSTAYVNGLQSNSVGCSLKHYCGNNQEYYRMSIDGKIDERALREIYLPAFENTVKRAQPWQVMCSYNKLNGTYLSDSRRMLTDILRKEWHFDGLVVSDWGAVNNREEGIRAGLDLEMPTTKGMSAKRLVKAVKEGSLDEKDLDVTTERVLTYIQKCTAQEKKKGCDYATHHALCRKAGASGAVLLKNENDFLPFDKKDKIAVIGKLSEVSRYQGAGSSRIECKNLVHFIDALYAGDYHFTYAPGYTLDGDGRSEKLVNEAVALAQKSEKVVLVIGLTDIYESEGFDRTHMDLPAGHNELVEKILAVNPNVAVILQGGSPVAMPWKDKVKSILNVYLQGEGVGESMCDLIFGEETPGGKLAETYPEQLADVLSQQYFPMGPKTVEYRESIFVGYRYFDTAKKTPAFPFGFGLSYTDFAVSDFVCPLVYAVGDEFTLSCKVTNTGKRKGSEVIQVYVRHKNSPVFKADKELKGFEKVYLQPGESKDVSITLDRRSFAFYNTALSDWSVLGGEYEILVGTSSRNILFAQAIKVAGEEVKLPVYAEEVKQAYEHIDEINGISKEVFEQLYGEKLPDNKPYEVGELHENCTLADLRCTKLGRFVCKVVRFVGKRISGDAANSAMIVNTATSVPLRALSGFSGGLLSLDSVAGLVDVFNKKKGGWRKFFRGLKK